MTRISPRVGFNITLGDSNVCCLQVLGDKTALGLTKKYGMVAGTLWAEDIVGTNSAALAMALKKPMSATGYEHFGIFGVLSTGCSVPITDSGRIIEVLSMTSFFNRYNDHTLGMVVNAVKNIESRTQ